MEIPRNVRISEPYLSLADVVEDEIAQLKRAGMKPTEGDIKCIIYGHLTRMTIQELSGEWNSDLPAGERMERFSEAFLRFGDPQSILDLLIWRLTSRAPRYTDVQAYLLEDHDGIPL
ncbi:MAG: hypothetical protein RQM90_15795 [Methanoculleus sp.]